MKCSQSGCEKAAVLRYTLPGTEEMGLCWGHPDVEKTIKARKVQTYPIIPERLVVFAEAAQAPDANAQGAEEAAKPPKTPKEPPPRVIMSAEKEMQTYNNGAQARESGHPIESCRLSIYDPYRVWWVAGFHDTDIEIRAKGEEYEIINF